MPNFSRMLRIYVPAEEAPFFPSLAEPLHLVEHHLQYFYHLLHTSTMDNKTYELPIMIKNISINQLYTALVVGLTLCFSSETSAHKAEKTNITLLNIWSKIYVQPFYMYVTP